MLFPMLDYYRNRRVRRELARPLIALTPQQRPGAFWGSIQGPPPVEIDMDQIRALDAALMDNGQNEEAG